jgi:hypothetical protein
MTTSYYLVAVDDNGDVMAGRMTEVSRSGLDITLRTPSTDASAFAFENQGDDSQSKWESARDALAAVMPDDEDN